MGPLMFYMQLLFYYFTLQGTHSSVYGNNDSCPFINSINSIQSDWQAEENDFSNLDSFELKKLLGLKIDPTEELFNYRNRYKDVAVAINIPDNFDARQNWPKCPSIGSVKDQSNCGSCWAISTAATISDRFCIASRSKIRVNLSSQALMTCCTTCTGGAPACKGGYLLEAWRYSTFHGLVTGGDYGSKQGCQPYSIKPCPGCSKEAHTPSCVKNKCTNKKYKKSYKRDLRKNRSYYGVHSNVSLIQSEILRNGPVVTGFSIFKDYFTYRSGVYKHVQGEYMGNHAVVVIGWGLERRRGRRIPYWLAVNSWGESWGERGLFKILRGSNECGFETHVIAGIPRLK